MADATTFHLVRHASYDQLGRVLAGRTPGHSLNRTGQAEAEALAEALAERPIAAVFSSPLERARETAHPVAARHSLRLAIDPALDEIDFGEWAGLTLDELHAYPAWRRFNAFRSTTPIPGGETMLAVQARALAALIRMRSSYPEGEVVAVSHGDVIKAILAHFLALPLDLIGRIEVAPASRSVVVLSDRDARILAINLPP
jgi:broad specificity phosphatase PhoE